MARTERQPYRNRLLKSLNDADLALLESELEPISLQRLAFVEAPHRRIRSVVFVEKGIVSVVLRVKAEESEVGVIGLEGMTGTSFLLGSDSTPLSSYVQVTGTGWQISTEALAAAQERSSSLRKHLLLYCDNFSLQKAYTAASNARSPLVERLSRWLMMAHDRLEGDDIPLTHEILSYMLGTRRPGVTEAIHRLVELGVVFSERGRLIVRDRPQLERLAGRFYGECEKEYSRLVERGRLGAGHTA